MPTTAQTLGAQNLPGAAVDNLGNIQPLTEDASKNLLVTTGTQCVKVNAGSAAPGQTLKTYVAKVALSTTVITTLTLETVTTGKTFFITDIFLSHDTASVIDTRVQANGVDIFRAPIKGDTAPVQMSGIETQPNASSGQVVTVLWPIVGAATFAYANIYGYEQ